MCADKKTVKFSSLKDWSSLEELLLSFSFLSRSFLKKNLENKVRKKRVKAHQELEVPLSILNHQIIAPYHGEQEIEVVGESENILALFKPTGMHCYPLRYDDSQTVVNWLRNYRPELLTINKQSMDRGLLYRLDQGTSGVLLYAKEDEFYKQVRQQFNLQTEKKYLAIVRGKVGPKSGELSCLLAPFGPSGAQMQVVDEGGQRAQLFYKLLSYSSQKELSLLEIDLKTGLRHQIRVQLAGMGFPIIGDTLYGGESSDRIYLHALSYKIGEQCFESTPKDELFQLLLGLHC